MQNANNSSMQQPTFTMAGRNGNNARKLMLLLIIGILLSPANASPSSTHISLPRSASKQHLNRPFALLTNDFDVQQLERWRGGGTSFSSKSNNINQELVSSKSSNNNAAVLTATGIIAIAALSVLEWDLISPCWETIKTFFDREKFRAGIIQTLNDIASKGHKGLFVYAFGFMFWECCGLPTSVVETAAGMAFGFREGLLGSFAGKTCGSILAFLLGRTLLSEAVGNKMETNDTFGLIARGIERHPIKSALILRYSPFPQLVKNFALSITKPVTLPIFLLTISIHGFPFSLLWAALGNDSSMRLRASETGESIATNVVLNSLLVFVTTFGFVVSPAITGWWLADLRKES